MNFCKFLNFKIWEKFLSIFTEHFKCPGFSLQMAKSQIWKKKLIIPRTTRRRTTRRLTSSWPSGGRQKWCFQSKDVLWTNLHSKAHISFEFIYFKSLFILDWRIVLVRNGHECFLFSSNICFWNCLPTNNFWSQVFFSFFIARCCVLLTLERYLVCSFTMCTELQVLGLSK